MNTQNEPSMQSPPPVPDAAPKVALITGITGQDGSYLAEFLLDKGYMVKKSSHLAPPRLPPAPRASTVPQSVACRHRALRSHFLTAHAVCRPTRL